MQVLRGQLLECRKLRRRTWIASHGTASSTSVHDEHDNDVEEVDGGSGSHSSAFREESIAARDQLRSVNNTFGRICYLHRTAHDQVPRHERLLLHRREAAFADEYMAVAAFAPSTPSRY